MIFALYEHPEGVTTKDDFAVVYDLQRNEAHVERTQLERPALVWQLSDGSLVTNRHKDGTTALAVELDLEPAREWLVRCDRVDFAPGGIAYRHVHPGPGIRRLLFGELTIEAEDGLHTYGPGEAWFEGADYPVLARASPSDDTAFVRVMFVPAELAGRRTIRYLDPADEDRPKLQRATILLEEPLRL